MQLCGAESALTVANLVEDAARRGATVPPRLSDAELFLADALVALERELRARQWAALELLLYLEQLLGPRLAAWPFEGLGAGWEATCTLGWAHGAHADPWPGLRREWEVATRDRLRARAGRRLDCGLPPSRATSSGGAWFVRWRRAQRHGLAEVEYIGLMPPPPRLLDRPRRPMPAVPLNGKRRLSPANCNRRPSPPDEE